jgi:hypothetical protein
MFLKKLSLITLCVLAFLGVNSQSNFKPAYIIKHGGDTVKGSIDYRNWDKNPEKISFRGSSGNTEDYLPLAINSFYVEGNHYESAIVDVEESATMLQDLGYGHELVFKTDTVFLQKLIDGSKSLYGCVLKTSKEQFYIKNDSRFELLGYKKYMAQVPPNLYHATNSRYLNQLSLYCQDCPNAMKFLEGVKYRRKDLVGFFKRYYKCVDRKMNYEYEVDKLRIQSGAVLGYTMTSFKIESEISKYSNIEFSNSSSISGGLSFDLMSSKGLRKFSFYNELFFSYYKLNNTTNYYQSENEYSSIAYILEYSYININNMLRYRFKIGHDKTLFINGGLSNGFVISETNKYVQSRKFYGTERITEGVIFEGARQHELSYLVGLGLAVKKFSFETRFQTGPGISSYSQVGTDVKRLHFLIGYRF